MRNDFIEFVMVLMVMTFILGVVIGFNLGADTGSAPDCPQEDSCRADYHDGEWHIIEVTP